MSLLSVEIVSPQGIIFKGDCHLVVVPASSGELGLMSDHEAIITDLQEGKIEIFNEQESSIKSFEIKGGFAEINNNKKLSILVD